MERAQRTVLPPFAEYVSEWLEGTALPNLFVNSFREKKTKKRRFFLTGSLVMEQMTTLTLMCHVSAVQTWMALFLCVFLLLFFFGGAGNEPTEGLEGREWGEGYWGGKGI